MAMRLESSPPTLTTAMKRTLANGIVSNQGSFQRTKEVNTANHAASRPKNRIERRLCLRASFQISLRRSSDSMRASSGKRRGSSRSIH